MFFFRFIKYEDQVIKERVRSSRTGAAPSFNSEPPFGRGVVAVSYK